MAYFCVPTDSVQMQMSLMRTSQTHFDGLSGSYAVMPPYAAYEDFPRSHAPRSVKPRPASGFVRSGQIYQRSDCMPCSPCGNFAADPYVHKVPRQLKRSRSFTQTFDNPVVLRTELQQSLGPSKQADIPLYNSLEDPHLEEYYKRKFKVNRHDNHGKSTVVANGSTSVDACAVYKVVIATGDMTNAGTYANVFLRINGARGKLNKVRLKKPLKEKERSATANSRPFHFAPGSVHSFKVYCPDLGDLRSIILEHDGLEKKDSWFVEYVEVSNVTRNYTWHFSCNDWLSAYKSDGKIAREIFSERIEVADYEIIVITGDRDNCETDANVFITLFGKRGHTDRLPLKNRKRWCFRRGQTDRFVVRARNVGKMKKIRIEHDNSGLQPRWFVERIVVCNREDPRDRCFFACGTWLSLTDEDGVISREFLASSHPLDGRKERRYKIVTFTGKQPDAGTDSDIFIQLIGELGVSENLRLETPYLRCFERGAEDAFLMRIPSVGVLQKLKLRNCNNGIHPGWYLVKIIVEDMDDNRMYEFPCRRWIGGDRSRGHVHVELIRGHIDQKDEYDVNKAEIEWTFRVHTSNIRNAGTDAHVFMQMYGEKGKTKVLRFEGAGATFETGRIDEIKMMAENVGKPYKIRVWHDNKGAAPGWHLDKVEIEDVASRRRYVFPCGHWLATDEEDGEIVRELPATGDGVETLPVLKYLVTVSTGKKTGSGTDANVYCCLFGERGDTGERQLLRSATNTNKFETGNADQFTIAAVDLKRLTKLLVGHDNSGAGPGWFLDKITVRELSGKYGGEQVFPCNRWLAKDEDDGQISRELTEFGSRLQQVSYQVLVKTGDLVGAGTDANVFMTLCGQKAESARLALKTSETHKVNKFERNQIDDFNFELDELGPLKQVKVSHDGAGGAADWYLEEVTICVPQSGLEYLCPARRWIKAADGEVILPVTAIKEKDKTVPYEITIWTGKQRGAGTDANVFVQLFGRDGKKTDEIILDDKSNNFESGAEETFKINAADVGPIEKLRIGHDNSGGSPGWFVDKIKLQRLKVRRQPSVVDNRRDSLGSGRRPSSAHAPVESAQEGVETYWFFVNRWFAKDEDDKQIVRVFLATDETGRPLSNIQLSEYELHVLTGNKMGAGTDANVFVNIFGDHGESGIMQLKDSLTNTNKFENGKEDVFVFSIPHLGNALKKLHIRTDASGAGADWLLSYVDIIDKKTGKMWFFNCNDWIGKGKDKSIFKDLPALPGEMKGKALARKGSIGSQVLEESIAQTTYNIDVVTGKENGAGTDANVYIVLYGDEQTDQLWLKNSKTHRNKFENGQTDRFEFKLIDIGDLKKIKIGHDNSSAGPDWFLEQVVIEAPRLGHRWIFPCKQWFSKDRGDKRIERELYPQELATEDFVPHVPYEITVVTSNKRGAGTDADVFINIYGPLGNTGNKSLCTSKEERQKRFEDGSVDTFVLELPEVGDDIQKIRIGHDNSGLGPGWHLDRVEVRKFFSDPHTGQLSTTDKRMWLFPCNNWFDKREGDGQIVRELVPAKVMDEFVGRDGKVASKEHVLSEREKTRQKKYKVLVHTGDKAGAGSDANVFVTFYSEVSDTGEHKLASSQNFNKFERGQMDEFEITAIDIGIPTKCRIRQDNSSLLKSAWYLDRVELLDTVDNKTYTFHCERWLSSKHDDKKIERILWEKNYDGDKNSMTSSRVSARVGSQVSLESAVSARSRINRKQSLAIEEAPEGPVIPYIITIRTAKEKDAGTNANAWCRFFGPAHKPSIRLRDQSPRGGTDAPANTGRIFLEHSHKNGFLPGSTETFSIEAADVGDIYEVELGHDGETPGSGWLVTEMTLEVPTRGKRYVIPFNCWFAKDQGDGRTVRIVPVDQHQLSTFKPKVPFEITFVTGDIQDAGTSSNVIFTLFGEAKSTGEIVVDKTDDRFERASKDTVKLELEDIGKPIRLRVTHSKRGDRQDWFLDHVDVVNLRNMDQTRFQCGQWLSEKRGEKKLVHDLVPIGVKGRELLNKTSYKIHVKTSSLSGAGTSANVFAIIFGQSGDSGEIPLKKSETHSSPFHEGKEDVFSLNNIYSLGELTKVRIWHDNSGFGSSWHLESVRVLDTTTNKWYDFPCNRWLSKSEDDKQIVRELPCATAVPQASQSDRTVYEIAITTSDKEGSASMHNAWIVLHGEKGVSREFVIENSLRNQILRTGQTDTFKMESRPLGKLSRATIGLVARADQQLSERDRWHCHQVVVTDVATGDKYVFPCSQYIPLNRRINIHDGTILHLKNVETGMIKAVRSSQPVKYEIAVVTGENGTDANVSITLYGELGDTGKRELKQKWKNLFENGQTDTFTIEALDLGELTKAKVEHDNSSWRRNWFLERVEVTNKTSGKKWTFPCKNWLSKEKGDFQIARELLPAPSSSGAPSPREPLATIPARPESPQTTSVVPSSSPYGSRAASPRSARPESPLSLSHQSLASASAIQRPAAIGALPASTSLHTGLLRRPTSPGSPLAHGGGVPNYPMPSAAAGLARPPSSLGSSRFSRDF